MMYSELSENQWEIQEAFGAPLSHQEKNPTHKEHFSIHDAMYFCEDCDWMEAASFVESEFDAEMNQILNARGTVEEIEDRYLSGDEQC